MAKRGSYRQKGAKDFVVNIFSSIAVQNPSKEVAALAKLFEEAASIAILNSLCNYCGSPMTRAANIYIRRTIIPAIVKHPNIDFKSNLEYRGALGVPRRFNYTKLKQYLSRSLVIEVRACSEDTGAWVVSAKESIARTRSTQKKQEIVIGIKERASQERFLELKLERFVQKAYKNTAFPIGNTASGSYGKRNWLIEADTGKTEADINSHVFPEKGQPPIENFKKFKGRRGRRTMKDGFSRYSRSGTHIMVDGGNYDPNEWRPQPSENSVIIEVFMKRLPGMLKRIKLAASECLKRRKRKIQQYAIKALDSNKPIESKPVKDRVGKQATQAASEEGFKSAGVVEKGFSKVEERDTEEFVQAAAARAQADFEATVQSIALQRVPIKERTPIGGKFSPRAQATITRFKLTAARVRAMNAPTDVIIRLLENMED